ncbi:hypothetical protein BDL97_07G059000 [Sphagnum fallax]|nr:hypothetical protein BDL97_07G059000 [Sphagnum fallax]KAH8956755.1 hypothetical protein BDL97_07G059000 [Sphagnum fallax]KAH8956756.1 hypothetical protein BDL97_07G059000 [Sphagnum fallax]
MYKSQLQEFAQKAGFTPPLYEFVKEGPSHEPRFKSMVTVNSVTYESNLVFPNLKSAEHAAAKVALNALFPAYGVAPSPVHESGLCKNLLQEYAQKNGAPLPVYHTARLGEDHSPTFTSTVEIGGVNYSGGGAKNKKEAEIKAARTALLAIQSTPACVALPPIEIPAPHFQVANLIKGHKKGRKRLRANQQLFEEPIASRLRVTECGTPQAPQVGSTELVQEWNDHTNQTTDTLEESKQGGLGNSQLSREVPKVFAAEIQTETYVQQGVEGEKVDVVKDHNISVVIPGITPIQGAASPRLLSTLTAASHIPEDVQTSAPEINIELQKDLEEAIAASELATSGTA